MAYKDCMIWKPLPKGSAHGFIKEIILFNLYGAITTNPTIPIKPIIPNLIKKFILTPDINNKTITVTTMIIPVPKSGCNIIRPNINRRILNMGSTECLISFILLLVRYLEVKIIIPNLANSLG